MSQHDYIIDNALAPAFRADLNLALAAAVSTNSGATAPATTYANMLWYDTANDLLKIRNEANSGFITLGTVDQSLGTFTPSVIGGLATTSEIWGLSGTNKIPTTAGISAAASLVSPSGASDWTPDWSSFISATWVLTAGRVLNNPTNVIAGTSRVVRISSDSATSRAISYGTNYKGFVTPSVTNSAVTLLTLYAASSTEIVVSSVEYTA